MAGFLMEFVMGLEGAFSRRAAFAWFVAVFAGFMLRSDWLGATSLIRALDLSPALYPSLLHFFHSESWTGGKLLRLCVKRLAAMGLLVLVDGNLVIVGDETKAPKEGRRMPNVKTLRQTSETSSKPSYFRGHEWMFLGVLIGFGPKLFCAPVYARLSDGVSKVKPKAKAKTKTKAKTRVKAKIKAKAKAKQEAKETGEEPRTAGIVKAAAEVAADLAFRAYLVLDAFYGVGPVFVAAREAGNILVVTRAKSNCVAHIPAAPRTGRGRGRPRKYDGAVKLGSLYASESGQFETRRAKVYGREEDVRLFARIYHWKPAGGLLLFVLAETSAGRITLMCSRLDIDPVTALELYCHRSLVEVMFGNLKNLLGAMEYRFWSAPLAPQSRRPASNPPARHSDSPKATARTLTAISNFVHVGMVALAFLQAFACKFGPTAVAEADCWLRTSSGPVPSEFVAKLAAGNILRRLLRASASNPIAQIIRAKQRRPKGDEGMEATG